MRKQDTILIVGYGSAGRRHTRNLRRLGHRNLVFLRSGKSDAIDDEPPPGPVVSTLTRAMSHEPVAAVIATPSALHLDAALPLAEAGCHLFVEKPLASDPDLVACEELVAVARTRGIVTMVGCQFRFHPLLRELRQGLEDNRLGTLIAARSEWGEYLPEWHPWEDYRESYAARADLGGGVLLTLIHPVDYLLWLFGEVVDVRATCRKVSLISTDVPDDWADLSLRFGCGILGHVHLDYIQKPPVHELVVWGHEGRVDLDFHAGTLSWTMCAGTIRQTRIRPDFTRNDMFISEMRHFLAAVAARRPTDIPLDDGVAGLRIVAMARQDADKMTTPAPGPSCFGLHDRVICVTGGGGFLGRSFVQAFVDAGARVAVVDRDLRRAEDAARDADGSEERTLALEADIRDPAAVSGFTRQVLDRWGEIHVLVNNAAIDAKFDAQVADQQHHTFEAFPLDLWNETMDVNLAGTFLCCQAVGKVMRQRGNGSIVNIASTYGVVAPDQRLYARDGESEQRRFKPAAYPVSKAAVLHLTRYLAAYWANTGIRVNALSPHGVYHSQDEEFVRRFAARCPLGRMARPEEIVGPLLFLASDAASYVNGENLVVDGGWTAW